MIAFNAYYIINLYHITIIILYKFYSNSTDMTILVLRYSPHKLIFEPNIASLCPSRRSLGAQAQARLRRSRKTKRKPSPSKVTNSGSVSGNEEREKQGAPPKKNSAAPCFFCTLLHVTARSHNAIPLILLPRIHFQSLSGIIRRRWRMVSTRHSPSTSLI